MYKAFGVYFKQAAIFPRHLNHICKRVYFGDAEVGAVIEDVNAFVWEVAAGFVVPVELVGKTAQEAATLTGNLHRVERKILVFCHADRNRAKLVRNSVAAEWTSTNTKASCNAAFIANTNLAKFNAHFENADKVFYELAEIYTIV